MKRRQTYTNQMTPRGKQMRNLLLSRNNLLLVAIITLINVIMAVTGSETYYLFTATIPYYLAFLGGFYTGKMPADSYEGFEFTPLGNGFLIAMLIIALAFIVFYALCWFFSKKKPGWLIAALVMFSLDTVGMVVLFGISLSMLLDILFHAWVLYYLIIGVVAINKLKDMPEEEPTEEPLNAAADPYSEYSAEEGEASQDAGEPSAEEREAVTEESEEKND